MSCYVTVNMVIKSSFSEYECLSKNPVLPLNDKIESFQTVTTFLEITYMRFYMAQDVQMLRSASENK